MPRLSYMTKDRLPPEDQHTWDELAGERGVLPPSTALLMYHPEVAEHAEHLGRFLRLEAGLPRGTAELVILMAARTLNCRREWAVHLNAARNNGARAEAIDAIKHRRAPENLTDEEAELFAYTTQLLNDRKASQEAYDAILRRWGQRGIVALTGLIGFYALAATVLNAFEAEPPDDPELQLPV